MRVIFMGTPDFALGTLRALVKSQHQVLAVVTQPDKPKGRGKMLCPTPVKEEALKYQLPVYQPEKVRDPEFLEFLKSLQPDLIVVVAFGQLLPKALLDIPKYGCFNVHASLLPKYRGAAPIQWAVIDGEKTSGVTIMRMDEGLDTGDIVAITEIPLDEQETGGSLFEKLSEAGAQLLIDILPFVEDGTVHYEKQPKESTTKYAAMLDKKMGCIDWTNSASSIECLIRGLNPWPSAYSFLNGKTLKIWKAKVCQDTVEEEPGTILLSPDRKSMKVVCGKDTLEIQRLQLEGKKQMDTDAFLRGYQLETGAKLTTRRD